MLIFGRETIFADERHQVISDDLFRNGLSTPQPLSRLGELTTYRGAVKRLHAFFDEALAGTPVNPVRINCGTDFRKLPGIYVCAKGKNRYVRVLVREHESVPVKLPNYCREAIRCMPSPTFEDNEPRTRRPFEHQAAELRHE